MIIETPLRKYAYSFLSLTLCQFQYQISNWVLGPGVVVGRNCTLVSCEIGQESLIGDRTVILEGARIGEASVIGPNSVVPPGRVIGDHQLWAGNPVRFIRDLKKSEMYAVRMIVRQE